MSAVVIDLQPLSTEQLAELESIAATINELHAAKTTIDIAIGKQLAKAKEIWKAAPDERRAVSGWQGWVAHNLPFGINKANDLIDSALVLERDDMTGLDAGYIHARAVRLLLKEYVSDEQRRVAYEMMQAGIVVNYRIANVIRYAPTHVLDTWRSGALSVDDAYAMINAYKHAPQEVQDKIVQWQIVKAYTVEWLTMRYTDYVASNYNADKTYAELIHTNGVLVYGDDNVHISQADRTQLDLYLQERIFNHIEANSIDVGDEPEQPLWTGKLGVVVLPNGKRVIELPADALDHLRDYELDSVSVEVKVVWS